MRLFNVDVVPLTEPFSKRLEMFWAGFWFINFVFGAVIYPSLCLYLLSTRFWWLTLALVAWVYIDRHKCEEGGRPSQWVQNWKSWKYLRDYYNGDLILENGFELDEKKNYLFCCHPHGVIPKGPLANIGVKSSKFHQIYPHFVVKQAVLRLNFFIPILKDLMLSANFITCSAKSLNHCLGDPKGGNIVNLYVGGAEEAYYSKPGLYKFVLKNRKGFVKIAMINGSPLVPVITFGETDSFTQIENAHFRKIQAFFKRFFGFALIIFNGRGFFQRSFGLLPRQAPLITVLAKPINVPKISHPTNEEIDFLHSKFLNEIRRLFEENKFRYLLYAPSDVKDIELEIL